MDGWRPAFVLCGRLSHTDTAWDSTGLTETDTSLLSLFVFLCQSSWAASMTAGSLRGVCWQLDGCCGQHVRTFTWKTNHRLTTVWLHRPKLICEWISAEFSRVKDASVASDLKLSSINKGKPCKNHTLEHQQHLKWKRNKVHLN